MSIKTKEYSTYEEYIDHQKSKANHGTKLYEQLKTKLT